MADTACGPTALAFGIFVVTIVVVVGCATGETTTTYSANTAPGGGTGTSSTCAVSTLSEADRETIAQDCLDTINGYRARVDAAPIARATDEECCVSEESKLDSEAGQAHSSFGHCGESGQCECPGWDGDPSTIAQTVRSCLEAMWNEGPPPAGSYNHYSIMTGKSSKVACGFFITADGKLWATQSYY